MPGPRQGGIQFNVQKQPVLESGCQKSPNMMVIMMVIRVARSQWAVHQPVPLTLGGKEAMGNDIPDVSQSSSSSSSFVVQVGTLPKFLDQCRSITSNRFVLNIVQGHHLQLSVALCYPIISGSLA